MSRLLRRGLLVCASVALGTLWACVPASEPTRPTPPGSVVEAFPLSVLSVLSVPSSPLAPLSRRPESLELDPVALGKLLLSRCGSSSCDSQVATMRDAEWSWLASHPEDWPASALDDEAGTLATAEDRFAARWIVAVACEGSGPADHLRSDPKLDVTEPTIKTLASSVSSARTLRTLATLAGNTCQAWHRYDHVFAGLASEAIMALEPARRCAIAKLAAGPFFEALMKLGRLERYVTKDRAELVLYLHHSKKLVAGGESCALTIDVPARPKPLDVHVVGSGKAGARVAHLDLLWDHPISALPAKLTFEWQANTTATLGSCDEPQPPEICSGRSDTTGRAPLEYVRIVVHSNEGRFDWADATLHLRSRGIDPQGKLYTY